MLCVLQWLISGRADTALQTSGSDWECSLATVSLNWELTGHEQCFLLAIALAPNNLLNNAREKVSHAHSNSSFPLYFIYLTLAAYFFHLFIYLFQMNKF